MEDRNWFRIECARCPYLVKDEILKMLHCVRPAKDEECLADGILVASVIAVEKHNKMVEKMFEKKPDPIICDLTKKRRAKIIKRRK